MSQNAPPGQAVVTAPTQTAGPKHTSKHQSQKAINNTTQAKKGKEEKDLPLKSKECIKEKEKFQDCAKLFAKNKGKSRFSSMKIINPLKEGLKGTELTL